MKNQSRARGQQAGKQMLPEKVLGGTQAWETGNGNSAHRWACVSECAIALQDFLICTFSCTSFQATVKQQFGPHFILFFLFI